MSTAGKLPNSPSLYDCTVNGIKMRFLIMDAPSDATLPMYISTLKAHGVVAILRVCSPTYQTERLAKEGIKVYDLPFDDGEAPPNSVISEWLNLLHTVFNPQTAGKDACIAVHCVAGLGRAPVMVAIAMMEAGMQAEDVVEYIRSRRRGALNTKQIKFLQSYKPKKKQGGCIIS